MPKEDTQFKPGQSGNPLGNALDRHSTKPISKWINEMLNDEDFIGEIKEGKEIKEYKGAPIKAIVGAQIRTAMDGDAKAADLLFKHGGVQRIEADVTSGGEPITGSISDTQLDQLIKARAGRSDT